MLINLFMLIIFAYYLLIINILFMLINFYSNMLTTIISFISFNTNHIKLKEPYVI